MGWEDPLEKEMATSFSILVWKIPWTEEPGGLPFMGSQRAGPDRVHTHTHTHISTHTHTLTHTHTAYLRTAPPSPCCRGSGQFPPLRFLVMPALSPSWPSCQLLPIPVLALGDSFPASGHRRLETPSSLSSPRPPLRFRIPLCVCLSIL